MKKTLRHIFAVFLVFAMLLPAAGAAFAVDATKITLEASTDRTLYYRDNSDGQRQDEISVKASVSPAKYDGQIKWTITDHLSLESSIGFGEAVDNTPENRRITIKVTENVEEEKTVALTCLALDGGASDTIMFTIAPDTVQPFKVKLDKTQLEVGGMTTARAEAQYASGDEAKVTFSSSNAAVAEIDEKTGVITAKMIGETTIYANAAGGVQSKATLTVAPFEFDYHAPIGQKFSLNVLKEGLIRNYAGVEFDKNDWVYFFGIDEYDMDAGMLYDASGREIETGGASKWGQLGSAYYVAERDRVFSFTVRVHHNDDIYTADVTITGELATIDINIPISGADDFSFADKAATGKLGYRIVLDAFSEFDGFEKNGSLVFDKPERTSQRVGVLSVNSDTSGNILSFGTVNAQDVAEMYFFPSRDSGTYEVEYKAYDKRDGKGTQIASGTLTITLSAKSLEVSVELDGKDPYVFSDKTHAAPDSARNLLVDAINGTVGKDKWEAVSFDTDRISRESYAVGTLFRDDSSTKPANELTSDDFVDRSDLAKLYFVPEEAGNYVVAFTVYGSAYSEAVLATGTLTISVANSIGSIDFMYVTEVGKTISLTEDNFAEFIQGKLNIRYSLAYITLDGATGGGTFYKDGKKYVPDGDIEFYSEEYEDAPKRASYISDLSFTAPNKSGLTSVSFTACGASRYGQTEVQGTFCIFYGATDVPVITYNVTVGSTVNVTTMEESDFIDVYASATGSTAAKPQFNIAFHTLPVHGLIYRNYDFLVGTGKALSTSDIDATFFTVGAGATRSVSILSFIPDPTMTSTDSATYLAYDKNGVPLYIGKINFVVAAPKEVTVSAEGLDFAASDFSNPTDPVVYVTFAKPAAGRFYVTNGSQLIAVTEKTKLWISDPTKGDLSLGFAHYIPREGATEKVTLTYTAYLKSGGSYEGKIIVTPTSRTSSAKFTDVKGNDLKWAANSVDFASRYGLVQGVGDGKFDPKATMRRCDLILIFYRMAGAPAVAGTMPYTDVANGTGSYAQEIYKSALWASQNGIVDGVVTGSEYKPKNEVTRQEYIRLLYNYTKAAGGSVDKKLSYNTFKDAGDVADFAVEAMKWAVANNYMQGFEDNTLRPKDKASRAQIVTFLHRYFTY